MTTRPTAQTTTSTSAWPPRVPSSPPFFAPVLFSSTGISLAPLWSLDLHSVRVAVRKSAREKWRARRGKKRGRNKAREKPHPNASNEGVKKIKTLLLPFHPHFLQQLFSSDDPGENDKWQVRSAEPSVLCWVFFFPQTWMIGCVQPTRHPSLYQTLLTGICCWCLSKGKLR